MIAELFLEGIDVQACLKCGPAGGAAVTKSGARLSCSPLAASWCMSFCLSRNGLMKLLAPLDGAISVTPDADELMSAVIGSCLGMEGTRQARHAAGCTEAACAYNRRASLALNLLTTKFAYFCSKFMLLRQACMVLPGNWIHQCTGSNPLS